MKDRDSRQHFLVVGLGFGDEGKGSVLNYLYNILDSKYCFFEKYNGGCHGRHTIKLNNGAFFSFSQLSPSIVDSKNYVLLSNNFVFEPFALINEIDKLSNVTCKCEEYYLNRVYIDNNTICVTPVHKLFNRIQEENMRENARGSVGTGVSIAKYYSETENIIAGYNINDLVVRAKDLGDLQLVEKKVKNQVDFFIQLCKYYNYDSYALENFDVKEYIKCLDELFLSCKLNIVDIDSVFHNNDNLFVYESSQGVLIDRRYGIKPNTTYLDTSCESIKENCYKIGVIRSIYTRHGKGIFPTEDIFLSNIFEDNSQEIGKYSGKLRFGWFDTVLYRYALNITKVNSVYMTCMDYLRYLDEVRICIGYRYYKKINEEFKSLFEYKEDRDSVIIIDIKQNNENLKSYLECVNPIYEQINLKGCSFSEIITKYLNCLSKHSNVKIGYISYGTNINDVEVLS